LKITYDVWWQIFCHEYRIKNYKDVERSGIYYNETTESYQAHYKADDHTNTKLITCINESFLEDCKPQEASQLVKELCSKLREYYTRIGKVFDVPQYAEFSDILNEGSYG